MRHRPDRSAPNPRLDALLRRAAAGLLACPYCQDALRAERLPGQRVRFCCPTCGFTEQPDVVGTGG